MPKKASKTTARFRETDLYPPVRDYLVKHGYTVRGEVLGCDIIAAKDDALIVVELKRQITLDLIIQGTHRQRVTDSVYIAVPAPENMAIKKWRGVQHVLRRLELGLMVVHLHGAKPRVDILFHPVPFARKKQHKHRRAILEEAAGRSGDFNPGGSTRRKIVTVYRENAIRIAVFLNRFGPQSPKALRAHGACAKTRAILYDNVYGWFERLGVGLYGLSSQGRAALDDFPELAAQFEADCPPTPHADGAD